MFVELPLSRTIGKKPMTIQISQIARYFGSSVTDNWTVLVDVQGNIYDVQLSYEQVKQKIETVLFCAQASGELGNSGR